MTDENKPLWQMTSGEFMEFLKEGLNRTVATEPVSPLANPTRNMSMALQV